MTHSRVPMHRRGTRTAAPVLITAAVLILGAVTPLAPVRAAGERIPSAVPASTPNVEDGSVRDIARVGPYIVLAGTFKQISSAGTTKPIDRDGLASFRPSDGVVTPGFAPTFDGAVTSVISAGDRRNVFVAGAFQHVNGLPASRLAKIDLATGRLDLTFVPPSINGQVDALVLSDGVLYAGGIFTQVGPYERRGLAGFTRDTGAVDQGVAVAFTGDRGAATGGTHARVGLHDLAVSPDGTRLVAMGNFIQAGPLPRQQVAMLSVGRRTEVVDNWATARFAPACDLRFASYVRDVDFSPDGAYFVIVTSGGRSVKQSSLCDSATRWETAARGTRINPTWTARTGADTLLSVAATDSSVFVGGHQRWLNNPLGRDTAGPGAVPRPGLAALQPDNGLPFAWNPGRNPRGFGTTALLATSAGLWAGSDTDWIGNRDYERRRIAFFPFDTGSTLPPRHLGSLPGNVYQFAPPGSPTRVNRIGFDGASTTSNARVSGSSLRWGGMRGAVMIDRSLFYGSARGEFYRRRFVGGDSFGPAVALDPYHDPRWSDVQTGSGQTYDGVRPDFYEDLPTVTGMFYWNGRLFYAQSDSPDLHWRTFSVDSGIVSQSMRTAKSSVDWRTTMGLFRAGGSVYFADKTTGRLSKISFRRGRLVGTATSLPAAGRHATGWASRGLVVYAGTAPSSN